MKVTRIETYGVNEPHVNANSCHLTEPTDATADLADAVIAPDETLPW
jgi:hypothetical protein